MMGTGDTAKDAVRAQYGSVGDAYVKSTGHATGGDLGRMVALSGATPETRMLDIATGGGHVARAFAPHVGSVLATDLTPEMIAHAGRAFREWGLDNVTTGIADAEELPYDDASFDLVTCRIAPHHFPDVGAFVREVYRVLVPGGTFILVDSTVPEGERGAFFNRFEKLRDPSHVRSLTIDEWKRLLEGAGFTVGEVETFTKTHDFADWTARSRTSPEDTAALARMLIEADGDTREAFAVTTDPDDPTRVVSFRDTKTLFVARR
ncbi:MAG TPA: class I SAM-dependent methyltransferase [Thermomicrobiales bacterium]|nr:class I SAM-dependent methyltransferase [Thermomicrobiales bacterium]